LAIKINTEFEGDRLVRVLIEDDDYSSMRDSIADPSIVYVIESKMNAALMIGMVIDKIDSEEFGRLIALFRQLPGGELGSAALMNVAVLRRFMGEVFPPENGGR
jgi:hypothetical protein